MHSLLCETFLELLLGLTFKLDSLGDLGGDLLLRIGDGCDVIGVSVGDDLGGLGLCLLHDLGLDELSLCSDSVVFIVGLSIDLLDLSLRLGLPLLLDLLGIGFDLLNFLSLGQLIEFGLLLDVLSLLLFDLLLFDFFFLIVFDSLVVGEGLSFEGVFELVDGSLLHRVGHLLAEHHIRNNDPLDKDTLIGQVVIQMLQHALSVLGASQRVGLLCLD